MKSCFVNFACFIITGVGVSSDGKRIYVTNSTDGQLFTLTRDVEVAATLADLAFKCTNSSCNLHVVATGQVFVFGNYTLSQVDTDGKKILNTMILDIDMIHIGSVYFSKDTSKMMIGLINNNHVLEFNTNMDMAFRNFHF
ncbi:hypothetical protein DPMN_144701 [Dreissena polymorpha]|uniref:Uncharacterized protein n=1 Tax=Dreissena polymorpha TaxID=45954 RepID=A0A9D4F7B1_DREPO|nr:hypothetical protein DPMN_144701 [Dreissena polymorpha]